MKKSLFLSIMALGAMMVACNKPVDATEEKVDQTEALSAEISASRIAYDLAKYGYEMKSASALIEAANILAGVPASEWDIEPTYGETVGALEDKELSCSFKPVDMLAAAKEYSFNDELLLGLICKVENKLQSQTTRGITTSSGFYTDSDRVPAGDYIQYRAEFRGHEVAEIAVIGDGDTDLDLYVYDENNHLIVSDTDFGDDCYVSFTPKWTGTFRIKIKNLGNVYNEYVILID